MIKESYRAAILLFLHIRGELTAQEEHELSDWRRKSQANEKFYQHNIDPENVRKDMQAIEESRHKVFEKIKQRVPYFGNTELSAYDYWENVISDGQNADGDREADFPAKEYFSAGFNKIAFWEKTMLKWKFGEEEYPDDIEEEDHEEPAFNVKKLKTKRSLVYRLVRIAAIFILVLAVSLYLFSDRQGIQPGGMKAQFFSGTGFSGMINDFNFGYQVGRAGFKTGKDKNGKTLFVFPNNTAASMDRIDSLKTPRSGEITIQFPDGTVMWIDAGSKLEYPAHFRTDTISIKFEGAAYLEIPQNSKRVFQIFSHGTLTQVNGDSAGLNISSYKDENVWKTTLLDGHAYYQLNGQANPVLLQPGSQAQVDGDSLTMTQASDTHDIVAWTNNKTIFHKENIRTIMRYISRWYDVDVVYEEPISTKLYNLDLPRDAAFKTVLFSLGMQGLRTNVQDKTITVMRYGDK